MEEQETGYVHWVSEDVRVWGDDETMGAAAGLRGEAWECDANLESHRHTDRRTRCPPPVLSQTERVVPNVPCPIGLARDAGTVTFRPKRPSSYWNVHVTSCGVSGNPPGARTPSERESIVISSHSIPGHSIPSPLHSPTSPHALHHSSLTFIITSLLPWLLLPLRAPLLLRVPLSCSPRVVLLLLPLHRRTQ